MALLTVGQEKSREYTKSREKENRGLGLHDTHRAQ